MCMRDKIPTHSPGTALSQTAGDPRALEARGSPRRTLVLPISLTNGKRGFISFCDGQS